MSFVRSNMFDVMIINNSQPYEYWRRTQNGLVYMIERTIDQVIHIKGVSNQELREQYNRDFFVANFKWIPKPSVGEIWYEEISTFTMGTVRYRYKVIEVHVPWSMNAAGEAFSIEYRQVDESGNFYEQMSQLRSNSDSWMKSKHFDGGTLNPNPLRNIYQTRRSIEPVQFVEIINRREHRNGTLISYRELKLGTNFHQPEILSVNFLEYFQPVNIPDNTAFIDARRNVKLIRNLRFNNDRYYVDVYPAEFINGRWVGEEGILFNVGLEQFLNTHIKKRESERERREREREIAREIRRQREEIRRRREGRSLDRQIAEEREAREARDRPLPRAGEIWTNDEKNIKITYVEHIVIDTLNVDIRIYYKEIGQAATKTMWWADFQRQFHRKSLRSRSPAFDETERKPEKGDFWVDKKLTIKEEIEKDGIVYVEDIIDNKTIFFTLIQINGQNANCTSRKISMEEFLKECRYYNCKQEDREWYLNIIEQKKENTHKSPAARFEKST